MRRVAVVGAGLSGLTAAIYLQRHGIEVTVYEASDRVGGRVTSDYIDGFICDRGFQVINPSYSEIRRLDALSGIEFAPISPNLKINGRKYGLSHPINSIKALPDFNSQVLNPFLKGVFLTEPKAVDNLIYREIIKSFILGRPGLPKLGVSEFSEGLADRVTNIFLNSKIRSITAGRVFGNFGKATFDAVVVATDPKTATALTGVKDYVKTLPSTTWYHATTEKLRDSKYLNIDTSSRLVNSIVISEVAKSYAPHGRSLIASTSLVSMQEREVRADLAKLWGVNTKKWELVANYQIAQSLALRANSKKLKSRINEKIFIAGDHRDIPSQNGAMRSGRRAALEVISELELD
jgi:Flavin containing amine oxidoreductase